MKKYPDNHFDLAVVDPPYGEGKPENAGESGGGGNTGTDSARGSTDTRGLRFHRGNRWDKYLLANRRNMGEQICKKIVTWDVAPPKEYFEQLFRISRNQIIWGGNYFDLPPTRCFLVWRKLTISESFSMAMAEYAWTSFNDNAKVFEYAPQGRPGDTRFHPCQKPVKLYEWLLNRYAKEGDTIIDTHVGSGSSLIACRNTNHKYVGFEIDEEYYRLAKERIDKETAQMNIFDFMK